MFDVLLLFVGWQRRLGSSQRQKAIYLLRVGDQKAGRGKKEIWAVKLHCPAPCPLKYATMYGSELSTTTRISAER